MISLNRIFVFVFLIPFVGWAAQAEAMPPELRTPSPVIYLADNLDEEDNLGWCIDTVGRGLSDRLHAHSCKPRGGDVQFKFDAASGRIRSATFDNLCVEILGGAKAGAKLGLLTCGGKAAQQFVYEQSGSEFRVKSDASLCLAVGPASRRAGPFMSRDLVLAACAGTETRYKAWVIKP